MIERIQHRILDSLILRPSRHLIEPKGTSKRVRLSIDRWQLDCFVHDPINGNPCQPKAIVLKFPGTAGRAEKSSAFPMAELGLENTAVWTWNPPGYGGSAGRTSLRTLGDAAVAFRKAVFEHYRTNQPSSQRQRDAHPPKLFLTGNSLGCCVALHVASELQLAAAAASSPELRPEGFVDDAVVDGLILRNPPPLSEVVMRIAGRYPMGGWMQSVANSLPAKMNAKRSIRNVPSPIVWICCESDRLVPPSLQTELMAHHPGTTLPVRLAGLDHHEPPDAEQQQQIAAAIARLAEIS